MTACREVVATERGNKGDMVEDSQEGSGIDGQHSVWLRTRITLIEKLQGGTPRQQDWEEFYKMYWGAIYTFATRCGAPRAEAEDLVQEVMVTILRRLPSFEYDRSKGRFLSWVKTVTRNRAYDRFRRHSARMEGRLERLQFNDGTEDAVERLAAPAEGSMDRWDEEWRNWVLTLALERVRNRFDAVSYEAFEHYVLKDMPPTEVATSLGLSVNAVYLIKRNGIRYLQEEARKLEREF